MEGFFWFGYFGVIIDNTLRRDPKRITPKLKEV